MCGITGFYSNNAVNAKSIVIEGLKKLEYRGYDSWGLAFKINNNISIEKNIGAINNVKKINKDVISNCAIGHTRWATNGGVTIQNAHPHSNMDKTICVVHNGIIENYQILKKQLEQENYKFVSETDTEVIPHLINKYFKQTNDFAQSVKKASYDLKGNYAFIAMQNTFNGLIGVKNSAPLLVGCSNDKYFIASDVIAFADYTKKVIYLDDDEMVIVK